MPAAEVIDPTAEASWRRPNGWSGFGAENLQRTSGKDLIEYIGPLEDDT